MTLIICLSLFSEKSPAQVELGSVKWNRDLDQAMVLSEKQNKPVFILFQEVPGCLTCRQYGKTVLRHPLIVEAIETLFVPVAIFNNKGGKDAEALQFFHEPSWNNPVVRIVDLNKLDVVGRVSGNYAELGIVHAMIEALENTEREIPSYLAILYEELANAKHTERIYLSMYCFWTGEKVIGSMEGVVNTEAGFMNGHEVVQVDYAPALIDIADLTSDAAQQSCADGVYVTNQNQQQILVDVMDRQKIKDSGSFRMDKESKYYLHQSKYRHIPLTKLQAVRVNSALGLGTDPSNLLSPRQRAYLSKINKEKNTSFPDVVGVDIVTAWTRVELLYSGS